jgi:hypothetical protein
MQAHRKFCSAMFASTALLTATAYAQSPAAPRIQVVYMGGADCPPCVFWRAHEFPKLASTEIFRSIRFTLVDKVIRSGVPPKFFLPQEAKPLKEKLDFASNGMTGSPHTVIFVDGEVFDYRFGTYSAKEFEERLNALHSSLPYKFPRCVKRRDAFTCEVAG